MHWDEIDFVRWPSSQSLSFTSVLYYNSNITTNLINYSWKTRPSDWDPEGELLCHERHGSHLLSAASL